jgi:hypothetical protein
MNQIDRNLKILPDVPGLYGFVLFIALVLFGGSKALNCADTLWHIRAGAIMLEQRSLLTHDIFSHTAYGQPWVAHEWLSEIIMALLHQFGGLPAVTIFYFLLVAFAFVVLFKITLKYAGERTVLILVFIAFLFSYSHLLARPHIFTWFFGAITLYILHEGGRKFYFLPLIVALWANLHGGVMLGLALQGIFVLGFFFENWERGQPATQIKRLALHQKRAVIVLFLSILAIGLNPFGYRLFLFPFSVASSVFSAGISEWRGPNLQELWHVRMYLLAIMLILLCNIKQVSWTDRFLVLFFINAGLTHVRHISVAAMFLTPFLASQIAPLIRRFHFPLKRSKSGQKDLELSSRSGPILTLLFAVLFFGLTASHIPAWNRLEKSLFSLPEKFSSGVISYLEKNQLKENLFNEYTLGGFLIYAMNPAPKVFIDGRADMYGEKIFTDYGKIVKIDPEIEQLLDEYNIETILFPKSHILPRYLRTGNNWDKVYSDDEVVVLVRRNPISDGSSQAGVDMIELGIED